MTTVKAPAKINLQLSVGAKGEDGYHDLATLFQAVSLYDEISVKPGESGSGITLRFIGENPHLANLPTNNKNLAYKAAQLFAQRKKVSLDLVIEIKKQIPIAGGMAGGSADAAGVLVALDSLYESKSSREELLSLARQLGSDVPFSLTGGTAVGTGRGDRLTPALARGTFHWVLAFSSQGLSTPAVYEECDRLRQGFAQRAPRVNEELMHALSSGDPVALGKSLVNDLQPAACSLRPALKLALSAGMDSGAIGAIVSGSGPTLAFLAKGEEAAIDLAVALSSTGAVSQLGRAHSPVGGPKVIEG
jgi:4-diphosphocytidyl-2-C-methyl-D-erythritol kinase